MRLGHFCLMPVFLLPRSHCPHAPPVCVVSSWLPFPSNFWPCRSISAKFGRGVEAFSIPGSSIPRFISWNQGERRRQRHSPLSPLRRERLQSRLGQIITNQRIHTGECCSKSAPAWSTAQGTICGRKIILVSCRIMPAVGSAYNSRYMNGVPPRCYGHPPAGVPVLSTGSLAPHKVSHGCLVVTERAHSTLSLFA